MKGEFRSADNGSDYQSVNQKELILSAMKAATFSVVNFRYSSRSRLTILQDEVEELRRETVQAVREKQDVSEQLKQAQEDLENLREEVTRKQDKLSRYA